MALTLFLMLSAVCAPALGQSELQEKQKAVFVFDIRMDMIRDCELGKTLKLEEKLSDMHAQGGQDGPNPAKLVRVFGAMSAPEDMASAMTLQMGQLPMEFFIRMKFADAEATKKLMSEVENSNGGTVEKNGKTYYQAPPAAGMPEGVLMHAVNETTVEMGTEAYVFSENRAPFTDNLKAAWSKAPNEAIRMAMDLNGAKALISEAVAMGKQGGNPMVNQYLDLVDNMKDAEELKEGLDSLLLIAKEAGKGGLGQLRQMDPEGADVAAEILNALNTDGSGTEVIIAIPKPSGFDKAIANAMAQLAPFLGGGGPGLGSPDLPPPPGGDR
jgi:hypothetical protein